MKKLAIVSTLFLVISCGICKRSVPPTTTTIINVKDSVAWHDSTIYTILPVERYRDFGELLDTLKLETSLAKANAYVDTTKNILVGSIENKKDSLKTAIKWKERIVYRDSLVTKEVPVEVVKEVTKYPKSYWWFLGFSLLGVVYFALKIYLKLKFNKNI